MRSGTRRVVLLMSAPIVVFALVGGVLSKAVAREDTYQHLKIFDDVLSLISSNYVEKVNVDKVMDGAMHGLAESLDPDSAYLSADQVKQVESNAPLPAGDVGIDLTRQFYLRIIAARDGSPAARAGLQTGDYVRAIDDKPTREMSVFEGMRALRGAPGSKVSLTILRGNANDPHVVPLVREALAPAAVESRLASGEVGYVRVSAVNAKTPDQVKSHVSTLAQKGAASVILDMRRVSGGNVDEGLSLARLFVAKGTLARRETRGREPETIAAQAGDGAITMATTILVDTGTTGAAEVFTAALAGNQRADVIGEHTIGRAAQQRLVKLPDGTGLWLTTTRYLTPDGKPLHGAGIEPSVTVDQPVVEFGQPAPTDDPILDRALQRLTQKKAA